MTEADQVAQQESGSAVLDRFREMFPERPEAPQPPLEVRALRVQFGGMVAVRDMTFDMHHHEIMSVIGRNGAGKSTLLNAITGLVPTTKESRIDLGGVSIGDQRSWRRSRAGLARAFQDPPLVDQMSIRDNLLVAADSMGPRFFARRALRDHETTAADRAALLLELIGLDDRGDEPASSLAYGARKLLDIARGLMSAPSVLLLDEPTSGLDGDEQTAVRDLLLLIRRSKSLTILMVEHHMELVRAVSDRVLVIDAGVLVALATPDAVLGGELLD